jgi:single-stranded DNA-binding protein
VSRDSWVMIMGRLQRTWTAEEGSARSVVQVVAEELGPRLRWGTATTTRTRSSGSRTNQRCERAGVAAESEGQAATLGQRVEVGGKWR